MDRQEGYYWVKLKNNSFQICYFNRFNEFELIGTHTTYPSEYFEHINEVRIKMPGELPD